MHIMRMSRFAVLPVLALLAACSLDPHVERPRLDVPVAYRATPASAAAAWPDADWWRGFKSPELDRLIAKARIANLDLAAAAAKVAQADAALRIAGGSLVPGLSLGSNGLRHHQTTSRITRDTNSFALKLDARYELDFWGQNRARLEAATQRALASRFDQETVALTVITSVATTYFTSLQAEDRLALARDTLKGEEDVLRALLARRAQGIGTTLDVVRQDSVVTRQRATIPPLEQIREQSIDALAILLGEAPERLTINGGSLDKIAIPAVAPGLPSSLLTRRPDIAEAEATLAAEKANVQVARAALFPTITLTAEEGYQSTALATLFSPGAALYSIAAGLTQTIFDGGALAGQLDQARGGYLERLQTYRKTVLTAFKDVDDALIALAKTTEQERLQAQAVAAARRAYEITRAELAQGTIDITTVLDTQKTLFSAKDALVQIRANRLTAMVDLFSALGGGWVAPKASVKAP